MSKFFITSSGTGIGKTLVTCALTWQLRQQGKSVLALKPVISDFAENRMEATDTYEIIRAMGHRVDADWVTRVSPWRFIAPLSPDMAARREGKEINFDDLIDYCRAGHPEDMLLIEGVGGAFVPVDHSHMVVDWIDALDMPTILVVGSYLGTLSHTIATYESLIGRDIPVAGIVISESLESPVPLEETRDTLQRFLPGTRFVLLPRVKDWKSAPDLTSLVTGA
ncbi:MAG: dethiobiotin synthase [Alphaproteobacteria bacterium]